MSTQGYFDYNATTPMCSQAVEALNRALSDFGNPSSKYSRAQSSKQKLALARGQVAQLLGCDSEELVFTSGGTEANNWAIKGILSALGALGRPGSSHMVISSIEHSSVLEIASYLERVFGIEVTRVRPDHQGIVTVDAVQAALKQNTILVSIMMVNNEVGAVQPIQALSSMLKTRGIHFHVDGVQAVGKCQMNVHSLGVDTLAFAAHKFYGPKGVGGLYIRQGVVLEPLLHGGGQEKGLRGGTEAVALIAAMGAAAEQAHCTMTESTARAVRLNAHFRHLLSTAIADVSFNGPVDPAFQVPFTLSVCIAGIRAEALAAILDQMYGIQVSLGSACSNNKTTSLSHVLVAMGMSEAAIKATLRISFGRFNQEADFERAASAIAQGVQALQRIGSNSGHEQKSAA